MIDTERPWPMRMHGCAPVVRSVAGIWRIIRGYDGQWWGSSDRIGRLSGIAGWLKRAYPENEHYHVSHETIYRSLYIQTRGVLKKELLRHLRSKRTMRRPRRVGDRRGQIVDLVSISQRPATVEDRAVPGHWEGDLLSGPKNSYIATLVKRHSRYVTLAKVANQERPKPSFPHSSGRRRRYRTSCISL